MSERMTASSSTKILETSAIAIGQTDRARRIVGLDVARGAALIGMAFYHLSWDLAYFGLAPGNFPVLPPMRAFSHSVAAVFLTISGISLALAHPDGRIDRAFWLRCAMIAGAAALVSSATFLTSPNEAVWFGILHCILLANVLAAPLLGAPSLVALAAAIVIFAVPALVSSDAMESPAVIWLGLGVAPPRTLDWRPLAPWAGFVFVGLAALRSQQGQRLFAVLAEWRPRAKGFAALAWSGRHSLAIYLIHQPIMLGLVWLVAFAVDLSGHWGAERFNDACRTQCEAVGGASARCEHVCACLINGISAAKIGRDVERDRLNSAQRLIYSEIVARCSDAAPR
jgi:uncharacterized membrane protein